MILISGYEVTDNILMMFLCLHPVFLIKCADSFTAEVCTAAKLKINTYCRCFINHYNAFFIALSHHFFTIWIMARSETVRMLPLHNRYILGIHRKIYSASIWECVLMLSISLEIKWLFINKESDSIYSYASYSIRKCIYIFPCRYLNPVKIRI